MSRMLPKALAVALLLGSGASALAANDGQVRVNQLLGSDPEYQKTWQKTIKKEERLPEWVINLSGSYDYRKFTTGGIRGREGSVVMVAAARDTQVGLVRRMLSHACQRAATWMGVAA